MIYGINRIRWLGFAVLCMASLGVAGYALVTYLGRPLGAGVHPAMKVVFETQRFGIYLHVFASSTALLLGPWQFLTVFRTNYPQWHRQMGRLYLVIGVGIGGLSGLYMSAFAFGGLISTAGFGLLAVAWLYTGVRAFLAARERRFTLHRQWMIRNFALTLGAVTLRIGLGLGFSLRLPFEVFYPALAWLAWVPNLMLAEWMIWRTRHAEPSATEDPALRDS
jgi:hypothetical protein